MAAQNQNNTNTEGGADPFALTSEGEGITPIEVQVNQENEIAILENEDFSGIKINGILGGLPVAEKNQEYFLVINEAGDTSPEIIGQTQFKISYLCDSKLNVSKPSGDGIALANATQNFERQKNAVVRVDQGTVLNNQLAGSHKITAVGSLEPIAGTQIGTGPLDYVTTMSFVPEGQLGVAPGLVIERYYLWIDKSIGYQNSILVYDKAGSVPTNGSSFSYPNVIDGKPVLQSQGDRSPLRLYTDTDQIPSGSAVSRSANTTNTPTIDSTGITFGSFTFDTANYFNEINVLTGSIEGNSRVRLKSSFGINIYSSSILDLFASALANTDDKVPGYSFSYPIILNLYQEKGSGQKNLIGSGTKVINTFNSSIRNTSTAGINSAKANILAAGNIPGGFDWQPDGGSATYLEVVSDYFSVEQGDKLYAEIQLPYESTMSFQPNIQVNADTQYFTQSLHAFKNTATFRQYQYFLGSMIVNQETPEGNLFISDVTGVTASYFTTQSDGFVSQSLFNNTGSYWVGFNNFTGSSGRNESFITASTSLTTFYGGQYYQVNPGTEDYNEFNASTTIQTSLGTGTNKKTWNNFGFNPIRLKFVPKIGDFIRFEYTKSKVFQIIGVQSGGNVLKLKLDGHIPLGTVVDNFVIYRIVEDGNFIILDVEKNNEASVNQLFTGIVTPQYPSTDLIEKSNTLLFDLKQAGIIEN